MEETFDTVAAIDLGSNSFHMLVARVVDGEVHVVDRIKERVALADGLDETKKLSAASRDRALDCLEKFGERVKHMPQGSVRAVGTNTFRQARNARRFVDHCEEALGHPIEVVSGREEARLVYLGVAQTMQGKQGRRLVVDIGGGSTECIIGDGFDPRIADSLYMGHITWSKRFFGDGVVTRDKMQAARTAAALEVEPIRESYRKLGWEQAVGSSGTILAIETIVRQNGWGRYITPKALRKLRKALVAAGHVEQVELTGLQPSRKPVLPGGLAILNAIFDMFEIEEMSTSEGAVREGLVYDLVGRMRNEDVRDVTVRQHVERYHVDVEQAARVENTAIHLLSQVSEAWELPRERSAQVLSWAARLHEVGISIAYSGYHKHGAYILEHSEMPGFSRDEQRLLSALVLCHRRKLRPSMFEELPGNLGETALRLCLLLRLAVRLNRPRSSEAVPAIEIAVRRRKIRLTFPDGWLLENPLLRADLDRETKWLDAADYSVEIASERGTVPPPPA